MASKNDSSNNRDDQQEQEQDLVFDYRRPFAMSANDRRLLDAQLAIAEEDAKSSGNLGFMARALVLASMPYKDPKLDVYTRANGDFRLRIVAGYEGGIPFGIYPRLLINWITTEAVITQSPVIELGDSLSSFLTEVLEVRRSGGSRGTHQRVSEQVKRTFGAMISAQWAKSATQRVQIRNVTIADSLNFDPDDLNLTGKAPNAALAIDSKINSESGLWLPQSADVAGKWRSSVKLTENFFQECITNPVPIDRRAYVGLRKSPLAMDLYTWLTYRFSYISKPTAPIPWVSLMNQFGSNYSTVNNYEQAIRDFKRNFLKALEMVRRVYPEANTRVFDNGISLLPSPTHIPPQALTKQQQQSRLF